MDPAEDFYISMLQQGIEVQKDSQGQPLPGPNGLPVITSAAFQVFVNPLMMWAWLGLGIIIFGLFIAIWSSPGEGLRPVVAPERVSVAPEKEVVQV